MAAFMRCRNGRYSVHPCRSQRFLAPGYFATNMFIESWRSTLGARLPTAPHLGPFVWIRSRSKAASLPASRWAWSPARCQPIGLHATYRKLIRSRPFRPGDEAERDLHSRRIGDAVEHRGHRRGRLEADNRAPGASFTTHILTCN